MCGDVNARQRYEQFQDLQPTALRRRPVPSYSLTHLACPFSVFSAQAKIFRVGSLGWFDSLGLGGLQFQLPLPGHEESVCGWNCDERTGFADLKYHTRRDREFLVFF